MAMPSNPVEIRFSSQSAQLQRVRNEIRAVCTQYLCSNECVDHIVIAVNEACANIIEHAYGGECDAEIVLRIFRDGQALVFHLIDHARPSDKDCLRPRAIDLSRPGGLGVVLINEVMDDVRFLECAPADGNVLEMRKRIE
jgi:sigma-B regulation protein RsbU (phosphoserine phosphatase)